MPGDRTIINLQDLVLEVSEWDSLKWRESRYEGFLDLLCEGRQYQEEAIRTALRYTAGGHYADLRSLARENWEKSNALRDRHPVWERLGDRLQLPDKLSGTLDLATATGKSYVIYGIAAILLAEGIVDRVLVLCPSTTIERSLLEKFRALAADPDIRGALPADSVIASPRVIDATETITPGSICVENRDAVYAHVRSSIEDSLWGKGASVAVLNDEAHHVANAPRAQANRWKEFLLDDSYGFNIVLGFSGTCYAGDEYFTDVIYRYSLRQAIEDRIVKSVSYVAEAETTGEEDERWQLIAARHKKYKKDLKRRGILPLTIIVTPTIAACKRVTDDLVAYLGAHGDSAAADRVLSIYSGSSGLPALHSVDAPDSEIEWIVSVSMLTEGWDVKRVFQIVPHEERAFNSKLLISQVLGRGLRMPIGWTGPQPEVTVFNHAAWAESIRHLVAEVLETERRMTSKSLEESPFHFEVHDLSYDLTKEAEEKKREGAFEPFAGGLVDIPSESAMVDVTVKFEQAGQTSAEDWASTVRRRTFKPQEVAAQMFNTLEMLDMEAAVDDTIENTDYSDQYPVDRLLKIVEDSLKQSGHAELVVTEANRQRFLQALGTLRRRSTQIVRYEFDPQQLVERSTKERPAESVSAAQLRRDQVAFLPPGAKETLDPDQQDFYEDVVEPGGEYRAVPITNSHDFKAPLNFAIADATNERRFLTELCKPANAVAIEAWIKSTRTGFYEIDYAWKKGQHQKRGRFSPDFFIRLADRALIIEIKGDEELTDPPVETIRKSEYAHRHFKRVEAALETAGKPSAYSFHCLCPRDYPEFFKRLRESDLAGYRSLLDVALAQDAS